MVDASLTTQLRSHFEKITRPIELVASLDDGPKSAELAQLLDELAALSDDITVVRDGDADGLLRDGDADGLLRDGDADGLLRDGDARRPSFAIRRAGTDVSVRFAGIPLGHEFTSLVLALLQVGGHPSTASPEVIEQIRDLAVTTRSRPTSRCRARTAPRSCRPSTS